jgi:predicted ATPase
MIERIIIENFKSIRKLDLELKPINILIGANGAGKSNLLSFFELINYCNERNFEGNIRRDANKYLRYGRKISKFISVGIFVNSLKPFYIKFVPSFHNNNLTIEKLESFLNDLDKEESGYYLEKNGRQYFELFSYFKVYHFQDTTKDSALKSWNKTGDNRYLRENGENLAAYLYLLQEKFPNDFRKIEKQISSVAPFFERFNLMPDRDSDSQIILEWKEKGSDDYFDAFDLSDGTLRFMALTTLLMQPELPKVIIIDEPELGLHPFAITKLAAMIRSATKKGSQIIISTQSIEFINHFEPEDIIVVDRKSDNYNHQQEESVFHRLSSEDLKDWLENYSIGEIWEKNIIGGRP